MIVCVGVCVYMCVQVCVCVYIIIIIIGTSLSKPHTSHTNGTSDHLRKITIKHGKPINSSIGNLNYTKNSRNGFLTIYLTKMAY